MRWLTEAECRHFEEAGTNAYRLADGEGCWVERYGDAVLISARSFDRARDMAGEALGRAEALTGRPSVYARGLVRSPTVSDAPVFVAGEAAGPRFVVAEEGLAYEVDLSAGYSCGLFLDQRENRSRLRQSAPGHLLNLFAFTCAFSVCAAAVGGRTVSVDLSKFALERGRRNFALNGFAGAGHRFYSDDVFAVLPRLARRGERFDGIIIDPPTFSRGHRGRVFRAVDHLAGLVEAVLPCAAPGAMVLLSTNASGLDSRRLRAIVREACPSAAAVEEGRGLPDIAPSRAAATLWFRTGG